MAPDTITILRCAAGLRLCKMIREDGEIVGYDSARTFDAAEVPVMDMDHLYRRLLKLADEPRCCVIRGGLKTGDRAVKIRRLAYDKGDECPATMKERAHQWVALDMEGIELPDGIDPQDIAACADVAIATLPKAFRHGRGIAQASASHGLKPGIRLRLWFWLDRALSNRELKVWLKDTPADISVFRTVQPIYTAAPVFENPAKNPVLRRFAKIDGQSYVIAPPVGALAPSPPRQSKPVPAMNDSGAARYAARAINNAAVRVATAAIDSRHETCVQEARGLGRLVKAGLLSASQVKEVLGGALLQAGKTKEEGELAAIWGLDHASESALPAGIG